MKQSNYPPNYSSSLDMKEKQIDETLDEQGDETEEDPAVAFSPEELFAKMREEIRGLEVPDEAEMSHEDLSATSARLHSSILRLKEKAIEIAILHHVAHVGMEADITVPELVRIARNAIDRLDNDFRKFANKHSNI